MLIKSVAYFSCKKFNNKKTITKAILEKYPSGSRGSPAKGVVRL